MRLLHRDPSIRAVEIPRPIVPVALAHLSGIVIGLALAAPPGWLAAVSVISLLISARRLWRARRIDGPELGTGWPLLVAVAALGGLQGGALERGDRAATATIAPLVGEKLVEVTGIVAEPPLERPYGVEILLESATLRPLRGGAPAPRSIGGAHRIALLVQGEAAARLSGRPLPVPGARVKAWGDVLGTRADTRPGTFDSTAYWRGRAVVARLSVDRPGDLLLGETVRPWRSAVHRLLRRVQEGLARGFASRLPARHADLARALVLGEAHRLPPAEREAFGEVGLAHLLAVSGLHTGVVLGLLVVLARLSGLSPRRGALIAIGGLAVYMLLTGLRPPVVRASVMGFFILAGLALGRFTTALASIALACCVTLLIDPRSLLRLDWQLSYACALSIILLAPPLGELFGGPADDDPLLGARRRGSRWRHRLRRWIVLPFAVTLAVQFGLAPIQLFYFHQFNPYAPLVNLPAIPLTGVALIGSLATGLVGPVPVLGAAAGWVGRIALDLLLQLNQAFAQWPGIRITMLPLPAPWLALYYALLLGGSGLLTGEGRRLLLTVRQRASLAGCMLGAAAVLAWAPGPPRASGEILDLFILDVGQGDAAVVRFPNGKLMVIDAGRQPPADQGRLVVAPFLRTLGADRIDCLVLTHADADHIGGAPYLLDHFPIEAILEGPDLSDSTTFEDYRARREPLRDRVIRARWGASLKGFEPVAIHLLGPVPGLNDNDASVVLLIDFDDVEILLPGDLEQAGERAVIEAGLSRDVEVVKLGHHGSRTSTSEALLEAFQPELALISVGRNNRYGHPAPEVLARLREFGVATARTDRDGTLWLRTDGRRIQLWRYAGKRGRP
ncbi:MAG: ComEC family competence protein [candidate division BRC1 bacterium ADurb.BinA292]|nr:MAG: ComEC family competence protein [candidate division BRC1 bacterium ADurb.BinA292]